MTFHDFAGQIHFNMTLNYEHLIRFCKRLCIYGDIYKRFIEILSFQINIKQDYKGNDRLSMDFY